MKESLNIGQEVIDGAINSDYTNDKLAKRNTNVDKKIRNLTTFIIIAMIFSILFLIGSVIYINYYYKENDNLKNEIGDLKRLNGNATIKINDLNQDNVKLNNEISDLKRLNEGLDQDKENLNNEINDLNKMNKNLTSTNDEIKKAIEIQNLTLNYLTNQYHEYINTSNKEIKDLKNCITNLEIENKKLIDTENLLKMKKTVLLITNHFTNNIPSDGSLYFLLSKVRFVTLDVIDSTSVQNYQLDNFNKYSAIVFDVVQNGYRFGNLNFFDKIVKYTKKGGSVFLTHNHIDYQQKESTFPFYLVGLKYYASPSTLTTKAKVTNKNHPIFYNYYNLTELNEFSTKSTYRSYSIFNETSSAIKLIDLVDGNGKYDDYLVVNKYGKGKAAITRAGYSSSLSLDEEKVFINTLRWLLFDDY